MRFILASILSGLKGREFLPRLTAFGLSQSMPRLFLRQRAYSDNEGEKRENKNKITIRDLPVSFRSDLCCDRSVLAAGKSEKTSAGSDASDD